MARFEHPQPLHDAGRPHGIEVPERAAAERGEPESEHRADVSVARGTQDTIVEGVNGLVEHPQDESLLDLIGGHVIRLGVADEGVDLVGRALLLPVRVSVESASVLPSLSAVGDERVQDRSGREPSTRGLGEYLPGFRGDLEADLVIQGDRSDGEAPVGHRVIDVLDFHALLEEKRGLVHVRAEDPVHVETGRVVDDDRRLPDPFGVGVTGRRRPRRGIGRHDDLDERHLLDG